MFNSNIKLDSTIISKITSAIQGLQTEEENTTTVQQKEETEDNSILAKEISGNGEKNVTSVDDLNDELSSLIAALNTSDAADKKLEINKVIKEKQTARKNQLIKQEVNNYLDKNNLPTSLANRFNDLQTVALYTSAQTQKDIIKNEIEKIAEQYKFNENENDAEINLEG
ncbi:hypothetical protein IJ182_03465 [bacterium]|nr:hypothetical protein [bacterium]